MPRSWCPPWPVAQRVGLSFWGLLMAHTEETPPDTRTPREIALQNQVDALISKGVHIAQVRKDEAARYERNLATLQVHADAIQKASGKRRRELEESEQKLIAALHERPILIARIEAGVERRRAMVHVLNALLTCEDDPSLTDEQHDERMDEIVKRARTLVAAERAAVLRGEGQS